MMDLGKPGITGNVKEISLSVEGDATAAERAPADHLLRLTVLSRWRI